MGQSIGLQIALVILPHIFRPGYKERNAGNLQYRWSVSSGEIVSGQGTTAIGVRQPNEALTATVEVVGVPEGCPNRVSETDISDPPPRAVKLDEFQTWSGQVDAALMDRIVVSLNDNPNTQLYILPLRTAKSAHLRAFVERDVVENLEARGIPKAKVTVLGVYAENELMQFCMVPAGASPPRCQECEELEKTAKEQSCPVFSLDRPYERIHPGDVITVKGNISPNAARRDRLQVARKLGQSSWQCYGK